MRKIEPALSQYRRNKDGDVSRWITAPDAGLIAEMGYEVRHLYTREALEAAVEAMKQECIECATAWKERYVLVDDAYESLSQTMEWRVPTSDVVISLLGE